MPSHRPHTPSFTVAASFEHVRAYRVRSSVFSSAHTRVRARGVRRQRSHVIQIGCRGELERDSRIDECFPDVRVRDVERDDRERDEG